MSGVAAAPSTGTVNPPDGATVTATAAPADGTSVPGSAPVTLLGPTPFASATTPQPGAYTISIRDRVINQLTLLGGDSPLSASIKIIGDLVFRENGGKLIFDGSHENDPMLRGTSVAAQAAANDSLMRGLEKLACAYAARASSVNSRTFIEFLDGTGITLHEFIGWSKLMQAHLMCSMDIYLQQPMPLTNVSDFIDLEGMRWLMESFYQLPLSLGAGLDRKSVV